MVTINLRFKKVKFVNFASYQEAELDLENKGICLVSGQNNCPKDSAASNGSGKSTIWNAICYALTGATLSGQTSNLKNIYTDSNDCFVYLKFSEGKDEYEITRYHKPKSDLKIIKNGVDISGKGIKESTKVLEDNLPQLTRELVASTIILGQGLPLRFSSYSPSGRKEVLENLTNSNAMIDDAKERVVNRLKQLEDISTQYDRSILVNETTLTNKKFSLDSIQSELEKLESQTYDFEISELSKEIDELVIKYNAYTQEVNDLAAQIDTQNAELITLTERKANDVTNLNESYNSSMLQSNKEKQQIEAEIRSLTAEITKIKSIKDVCPTCGQKLHGVVKPSTETQESELSERKTHLLKVNQVLDEGRRKYENYKNGIENAYANDIKTIQTDILKSKSEQTTARSNQNYYNTQIMGRKEKLSALLSAKDGHDSRVAYLRSKIFELSEEISGIENLIRTTEIGRDNNENHLAVVRQIDNRIKRDYRGYLLEDIVKYIDKKAKEYSKIVFGTSELSIILNGNSMDISYCEKAFDSLSGGEKQRVDLILQFAIRDLLQNNLGYSSNILALDEIFDGLDKKSTEKVIELIESRLKDVESIFVISHHSSELELPIDTEIRIVKGQTGISEIL